MTTPAPSTFDPLAVTCPHCKEPPGSRCGTVNAYSRKTHQARVKLALAVAAHTDPALDAHFPMRGECGLCGAGLPQRHRVVDAIAGALEAGETEQDVIDQFGVSLDAVMAVTAWMNKYPGAWK